MELVWEDLPVPEAPFFTRDVYDKYSLAPNIRELWAFLQSPEEYNKQGCGSANTSCSPSTKKAAEFKDNSCIRKDESSWDSCDGDNAAGDTEESMDTEKSRVKLKQVENETAAAYPEPRLPLPCMSNLSSKEQKTYLGILMSKKIRDPPQNLKERVNNEVMQFMKYLQDVAKVCADDYNFISQGAMQYSEEFLSGCLEHIKTFPELYQIFEMTSLTGGTFNPGLQLTFEKQLLIMGDVDITDHKMVPADAQLASDYQSVSSEHPPAKKAKDMHAKISTDSNAKRLSAHYEPEVCLTRDALVRLLDNHGPDFGEQWELPVWVKLNPGKGSSQKKTVYIDSPLLQTEMTVRERSHIYHEESLKLSIKKNGSKNVFHLMTELPEDHQQLPPECSQRNLVSSENNGLDFEVDLTDLETFGEEIPIKTPKMQNESNACVKSLNAPGSPPLAKTKKSSEHLVNTSSSSQEEMNTSLADVTGPINEETTQPVVNDALATNAEQMSSDSAQQSDENCPFIGDSDEEKLVIDDAVSPANARTKSRSSDPPIIPVPESVTINPESLSPQKGTKQRRLSKKAKVSGDQLGEILRMQTAMFNSPGDTAKCSTKSQETNSPSRCMGPSVHSHPTSLVKPCVSSYLERNQNQDGETCAAPHVSVVNITTTEHKKILSQDLQAGAEDEQDYKAPEEGNLLYKLYSLQDVLLMVRSSVSLTHNRKVGQNSQNQFVPVHVLPKLEYQLNYGVECLSSSEACQLWTETLLHSSTVSYIAHINAHTSKVALLRKLPDDWKQNISCGFKPSKSLNILHHLLKKLTRTVTMAMVSEFLGQLSLNIGAHEPTYPTVVPAMDFDPDRDAARIETAVKTKGVDEQTIIDVLTKRTYSQRRDIAFAYEKRAKKDMISALKAALSGSLETVILGLMKSTAQYDASLIRGSIKGAGTDEETLIEVLCSRSTNELVEIKKVYKELFKKDLEKDVAGDTSGNFAKLLLALVQTKRAEASPMVDYEKIDEDARALYEAGVKVKGTDVPTWISIMSERSVPHLQKVFQRYKSYSPYDMQESILKEVKGDLQKSFLVLVQCFENKQLYFAKRLNESMKSKGAKEKMVTRIIVSRCEVDLKKICSEYKSNLGESLQKTILEHTKGDYQKVLLGLCGPE